MHVPRVAVSRFLPALLLLAALANMALAQAAQPPAAPAQGEKQSLTATPAEEPELFSEEWFADSRKPVDWLTWGADLRLRDEYFNNAITLNKEVPAHEWHFQRYRPRIWSTITPVQDLDFNSRLTWEFRNWCLPKGIRGTSLEDRRSMEWDEALFDTLNVKWSNMLDRPATLTVGRQDIILDDGWLVLEGTPLDGSRTIFFDAARLNYNFEQAKTVVDLIYIEQSANTDQWIEPFNDQERLVVEQDQRGAILHVANKSLEKTELDGYFIFQKNLAENYVGGVESNIYAFGGRIAGAMDDHWKYRAELAQELGHKNYEDLCALGFNSRLSYFVNDKLNNNFRLAYEFLSGDDPDTDTIEEFDPLWGRWPQWSDLIVYTYAPETRIAYVTNLHRLGAGWSFNPTKKLEMCTDYHLLFADENTRAGQAGYTNSGDFRGQLVTAQLRYTINPHIKGHLTGDLFCPGNYYDATKNDTAVYLRYELVFTW